MPGFRFKQFALEHEKSSMKVGTDGVLLGAWAALPSPGETESIRVLDVGCGCGLIAMMLAQRLAALGWKPDACRVEALDLDGDSCMEACSNVENSVFRDYVRVSEADFLHLPDSFAPERYSRIVSNPPFFEESLKSPLPRRNCARHADTLPFAGLLSVSERLLEAGGRLSLVLPWRTWERMESLQPLHAPDLRLCRWTRVFSRPGKACERVLAEWVKSGSGIPSESSSSSSVPQETGKETGFHAEAKGSNAAEKDLLVQDAEGAYTEDYRNLVKDFYLWA